MEGIEIVDSDAKNDDYQLSSNEEDDDETSPPLTNTQNISVISSFPSTDVFSRSFYKSIDFE